MNQDPGLPLVAGPFNLALEDSLKYGGGRRMVVSIADLCPPALPVPWKIWPAFSHQTWWVKDLKSLLGGSSDNVIGPS